MSRETEIAWVTLVGSVVNLLLVGGKAVAGVAGHSAAMVSDAVHSLSDFVTDIVVLVFVRVSARPQDEDHDYGHGKFETLATLLIGLALAAAAVGIVVSGAVKLARWLQGEDIPAPGTLRLGPSWSRRRCFSIHGSVDGNSNPVRWRPTPGTTARTRSALSAPLSV